MTPGHYDTMTVTGRCLISTHHLFQDFISSWSRPWPPEARRPGRFSSVYSQEVKRANLRLDPDIVRIRLTSGAKYTFLYQQSASHISTL